MTKYDPNRKVPTVTPEIRLRIAKRHAALWREPVDKRLTHAERFNAAEEKLTDAEWFEVLFIAAISHPYDYENQRKTVGEVLQPIMWMAKDKPRVKGWSEAKMQQHVAVAADTVIGLMSA